MTTQLTEMKNLIINGTFDSGAAHWSGTDIEAYHTEGRYQFNSSKNRVAEMDGNRGMTTVMEQNFVVDHPANARLTLDVALRLEAMPDRGSDGFVIVVLNDEGLVIASLTALPMTRALTEITLDVSFPKAGTYTLRFTEIGDDDSLGALIDNVKMMVCFASGTLIETAEGARAIETLMPGDLIVTDRGLKPLKWIFERSVSARELQENFKLRPIEFAPGALGANMPKATLKVSRQHRMVAHSRVVKRMFGISEVLLPAVRLVGLPGVSVCRADEALSYFHLLFDEHEIVRANGARSESFLVTARSFDALTDEAQKELRTLFPKMINTLKGDLGAALPIPELKRQKRLVARLADSGRAVLEAA